LALFSQSVTGAPVIPFGLAAMLSLALSTPGRGADTETVGPTQFLMMPDLHFDPMADPKLVDRLSSAEPEEWPGHFRKFGSQDARPIWRRQQLGAAPFGSSANEANTAEPRFRRPAWRFSCAQFSPPVRHRCGGSLGFGLPVEPGVLVGELE
jgi:hypothetical protein